MVSRRQFLASTAAMVARPARAAHGQAPAWQTMPLGPRTDMDQIADAVRKVQRHEADLRSL